MNTSQVTYPTLLRDTAGASAIEFALIAPLLLSFLMGIFDLTRGLTRKFQIEQASYRALELVSVGSLQSDYTVFVKNEAMEASGEPDANVQVGNWLQCENDAPIPMTDSCTGSQEVARYVQVTIFSDYKPYFTYGPLGEALGVDGTGTVRLTARSTVRVQ